MDNEKIGKIIKTKRKEKGMTQGQFGDMLGVSFKAVSKWENGKCMPDISILKKLCDILEISVDDLLVGKAVKNNIVESKNKFKKIIIVIIFISILIVSILYLYKSKRNTNKNENYECVLTKTYNIENINDSNDENYLYVTFKEFQTEGVFTIKLSKTISKDLVIGENYEFTFNTKREYLFDTIDVIFDNSELINIVQSNKVGIEQKNDYICN